MKRFLKMKNFSLDKFSFRQFEEDYNGTKILNISKQDFIQKVNEFYETGNYKLKDGYAPFCKHIFIPNFCGCYVSTIKITKENQHLLTSGYESRTPKELPVLVRWFPKDKVEMQEAKFLDVILYSREQIKLENEAIGENNEDEGKKNIFIISSRTLGRDFRESSNGRF
jgi:hypothetical protein